MVHESDFKPKRVHKAIDDAAYSAAATGRPWEIIVIDNSFEPLSGMCDYKRFEQVRHRWCEGYNQPHGLGINLASREAKYDTLVYFSSKRGRMIDSRWVFALVEPLADEAVGITGTLLPCDMVVIAEDDLSGTKPIHIQGGVFAMRTDTLLQYPFSFRFPHEYSDVWLSWRLQKAGLLLRDVPQIRSIPEGKVENPQVFWYVVDYD